MLQTALGLQRAGRLREAERACRRLLALAPKHAAALHLLGLIADQAGRPEEAIRHLRRAIALPPPDAGPHFALGRILARAGRLAEAEGALRAAIRLQPRAAELHAVLGNILTDLRRYDEAVASYQAALDLNRALPGLHNNIGLALREANRLEEAEAALAEAVRREPGEALVRTNHGNLLRACGKLAEAEAAYRAALRLWPDSPDLRLNLGLCLLLSGRFREGWAEYENRWRTGTLRPRGFAQPLWTGEALDGRVLLLHAEQGFGDTFQFCRYVPLAAARGGRVVLEAPRPAARLLGALPGVSQVVATGDALPAFDLHCPLMSLPLAFGTALETVPAEAPYLRPDPRDVAAWRERLAGVPGLKVGLVWAGSQWDVRADRRRSLDPARLSALAGVPGIAFVSLQKPPGPPLDPSSPLAADMRDWTGELRDWADTAALIETLDLVVGVDTAVMHLTGALGKPGWIMNRHDTCWRWLTDRDDSPWYPSLRLFRQAAAGDWDSVLRRVRAGLEEAGGRCPPDLPPGALPLDPTRGQSSSGHLFG